MQGMSRIDGTQLSPDDHLAQSVKDILTTKIGTRICRRDYGSDIPDIIDQPAYLPTKLLIVSSCATALILWEPRLKINQVQVTPDPDIASKWAVGIFGSRTDTGNDVAINVSIGSTA